MKCREDGTYLSDKAILEKAISVAERKGMRGGGNLYQFSGGRTWLAKFKQRFGIVDGIATRLGYSDVELAREKAFGNFPLDEPFWAGLPDEEGNFPELPGPPESRVDGLDFEVKGCIIAFKQRPPPTEATPPCHDPYPIRPSDASDALIPLGSPPSSSLPSGPSTVGGHSTESFNIDPFCPSDPLGLSSSGSIEPTLMDFSIQPGNGRGFDGISGITTSAMASPLILPFVEGTHIECRHTITGRDWPPCPPEGVSTRYTERMTSGMGYQADVDSNTGLQFPSHYSDQPDILPSSRSYSPDALSSSSYTINLPELSTSPQSSSPAVSVSSSPTFHSSDGFLSPAVCTDISANVLADGYWSTICNREQSWNGAEFSQNYSYSAGAFADVLATATSFELFSSQMEGWPVSSYGSSQAYDDPSTYETYPKLGVYDYEAGAIFWCVRHLMRRRSSNRAAVQI